MTAYYSKGSSMSQTAALIIKKSQRGRYLSGRRDGETEKPGQRWKNKETKRDREGNEGGKSRLVWGQREGRRASRGEKRKFIILMDGAVHNPINTTLSSPLLIISVSCSLLWNMTLHEDYKTSYTDQHLRHISFSHTHAHKHRRKEKVNCTSRHVYTFKVREKK